MANDNGGLITIKNDAIRYCRKCGLQIPENQFLFKDKMCSECANKQKNILLLLFIPFCILVIIAFLLPILRGAPFSMGVIIYGCIAFIVSLFLFNIILKFTKDIITERKKRQKVRIKSKWKKKINKNRK